MGSINDKLNYISGTKSLIKDKLNNLGSEINSETTFRDYANRIENLYEEWPKISDENTNITLNNTKKGKMNIELKGNVNQFTTTGKNKIHYVSGSSYLSNLSVTEDNNGSLNISGTPNRNWANLTSDIAYSIAQGTYTISINQILTFRFGLRLQNSNDDYVNITIEAGNTETVFTTTKNYNYYRLFFEQLNTSTNYNITNLEMQLEPGNSKTPYEPYTGGIASPNPNYPQDIKIVTGENVITILNEDNTETQTYNIDLNSLELCKINNVQDYIYKNNNKWYKKPMILKINNYNGETISTNYISTTGELSMNATVYYINPILNPNGIQIEDEILINQLNMLEQAMSYNNQTNISQENDNLSFIINASALMKNSD